MLDGAGVPPPEQPGSWGDWDDRDRRMSRGVAQLLFTYLPGRVVDWEDGTAIVMLTNVRLSGVWPDEKARLVLQEVAAYLDAWKQRGGTVSSDFPDPLARHPRLVVGEPAAIAATPLHGALICRNCSQLVFRSPAQLKAVGGKGFLCPSCQKRTLRQFGQVFVHGCGELVPLTEYLPWMKEGDGTFAASHLPVKCNKCGPNAVLQLPARSERARDMRIICRGCGDVVQDRLVARCPSCVKQVVAEGRRSGPGEARQAGDGASNTAVARVVMRLANSRANDAYYAHTLSLLRLDRPAVVFEEDDEIRLLTSLLPAERRPELRGGGVNALQMLVKQLEEANLKGDVATAQRLKEQMVAALQTPSTPSPPAAAPVVFVPDDVAKAIDEGIAFRTQVTSRAAQQAVSSLGGPTSLLLPRIREQQEALGIDRVLLVDDLPVILAAFGYTRRSFEPTYDEESLHATRLPTQLRPFYTLDRRAAARVDRVDLVGHVPILAREGDHEGIFLSLDPNRVADWLDHNGCRYPVAREKLLPSLLRDLEPVDRYYDGIWDLPVRRLVYGLIHSLSHAAMRVLGPLAGLERTSMGEYIFLPLLGGVIYANGSTMKMGVMETVVRDHLHTFLDRLADEALDCLYDPDCLDRRGACHGCLHAPEISCRTFNHGLSRAFLSGGHSPWLDPAKEENVVGFWQ